MEDNQSSQTPKRRVKSPETFRERAIKAASESDKPSRSAALRSAPAKAVRPVSEPLGRGLRRAFDRQPFRFIGHILLPKYVRHSWHELRLVSWPNWKLSRQLTLAVLGFAIVFGAAIAGVDYGLDKIFKHILLK